MLWKCDEINSGHQHAQLLDATVSDAEIDRIVDLKNQIINRVSKLDPKPFV